MKWRLPLFLLLLLVLAIATGLALRLRQFPEVASQPVLEQLLAEELALLREVTEGTVGLDFQDFDAFQRIEDQLVHLDPETILGIAISHRLSENRSRLTVRTRHHGGFNNWVPFELPARLGHPAVSRIATLDNDLVQYSEVVVESDEVKIQFKLILSVSALEKKRAAAS